MYLYVNRRGNDLGEINRANNKRDDGVVRLVCCCSCPQVSSTVTSQKTIAAAILNSCLHKSGT